MEQEDLSQLKIDRSGSKAPLTRRRRRRGALWIILILLAVVFLGILYSQGILVPAREVEVTTVSLVYPSQAFTVLNASGYVVAQRRAAVASKATGRLIHLAVEEGSRVKEGQILARLESADLLAQVNQAQANLNAAKANLEQIQADIRNERVKFERYRRLIENKAVARSEFEAVETRLKQVLASEDQARAQIKAAEFALRGAQATLEYTLIRAPFDGVILTKNADVGEVVAPFGSAANAKAAVVTMADMDSLIVEADVSEANLEKVQAGQPTSITLDALPEERFPGRVHTIVPTADRSKGTVLTKVKFLEKDKRVLPEMSAKVAFLSRPVTKEEEEPRLGVPPSALVSRNGKTIVYRVEDAKVREVQVQTGKRLLDSVEITQGLKAGERIVLNPPKGLEGGDPVKVVQK